MRPRAPVDEAYKIAGYEDLSKLTNLLLERGFFRRGYEEEDLTKHTPANLSWAKKVIFQKKLIDALDGKDLFAHLYHQIFNDMKALCAGDDVLRKLSATLNKMLTLLNSSSAIWLKYIGEDNDNKVNNVEYLRGDADTRMAMDNNPKATGSSKILNSNEYIDINKNLSSYWNRFNGEIRDLFIMVHSLTYAKMYELGDKARSDIIDRYVRLYSNVRVFLFIAKLIVDLDKIAQDIGGQMVDNIASFSNILTKREIEDHIGQFIGQKSVLELYDEILTKMCTELASPHNKDILNQRIPTMKAMRILSGTLLISIFEVQNVYSVTGAMTNIKKLVKNDDPKSTYSSSNYTSSRSTTDKRAMYIEFLAIIGVVLFLALIVPVIFIAVFKK